MYLFLLLLLFFIVRVSQCLLLSTVVCYWYWTIYSTNSQMPHQTSPPRSVTLEIDEGSTEPKHLNYYYRYYGS